MDSVELKRPAPDDYISVNGVMLTHQDIADVVDQFYRQVAEDDLLKVPFSTVHDWPAHIARMTHFWWIRFGGPLYVDTQYNPVLKHFHAGFNPTFLERWLGLFHQTLAMNLQPDQCQLWGMLADRMGQALTAKNEYFKRQQQHS